MTERDEGGSPEVSDSEIQQRDRLHLRGTIQLGALVERFLESEEGRHLRRKCEAKMLESLEDLGNANAADIKAITDLQVNYRAAKGVLLLLEEIVAEGQAAEQQFTAADEAGG